MTTKHTPGPWIVDDVNHPGDCRSDHVSGGYHYIDAGKGFLDDATGQGFGISGCISLADARLIAAAPDLLAALKALTSNPSINLGDQVYQVREREGKGWDGPDVTAWSNAVEAAKAVIAKVEAK